MKPAPLTTFISLAVVALGAPPALADGCKDISRINQSVQAARRQLDAAVAHDQPRRELGQVCGLSRQIDQGVKRMLAIIDADPRRCGRPSAVIQRLRDSATRLYLRTPCPTASDHQGAATPAG